MLPKEDVSVPEVRGSGDTCWEEYVLERRGGAYGCSVERHHSWLGVLGWL